MALLAADVRAGDPPPPRPTADLEPAEIRALWVFQVETKRAAGELGVPAPQVIFSRERAFPFAVPPTTSAFVWPGLGPRTVVVLPRALAWGDQQVRCYARHELAHVKLGHRGACVLQEGSVDRCDEVKSRALLDQHHREVAALMTATWGEDSRCR